MTPGSLPDLVDSAIAAADERALESSLSPTEPTIAADEDALESTPPPAPPLPPDTPTRRVRVVSTPPGAMAYQGNHLLGRTPLTVRVPIDTIWIIRIEHDGFVPQTLIVPEDSDRLQVALRHQPPLPPIHSYPPRRPWNCVYDGPTCKYPLTQCVF